MFISLQLTIVINQDQPIAEQIFDELGNVLETYSILQYNKSKKNFLKINFKSIKLGCSQILLTYIKRYNEGYTNIKATIISLCTKLTQNIKTNTSWLKQYLQHAIFTITTTNR